MFLCHFHQRCVVIADINESSNNHLCDLYSRYYLLYKNTKQNKQKKSKERKNTTPNRPTKQNQKKTTPKKPNLHTSSQKPKVHVDTTHPIFLIPACVCLDINFRTNRNNLSILTFFLHHCQLYHHVGCLKLETQTSGIWVSFPSLLSILRYWAKTLMQVLHISDKPQAASFQHMTQMSSGLIAPSVLQRFF